MTFRNFLSLALVAAAAAHEHHDDQVDMAGPHQSLWYHNLPGDGGTQVGG